MINNEIGAKYVRLRDRRVLRPRCNNTGALFGAPVFCSRESIISTCRQGPNAGGAPLKEMIAMMENLFAFVAAASALGSFILQLVREINAREEVEGKKNGR